MKLFHIEADLTPTALEQGRDFKYFFVKAKSYEEACAKVTKHLGQVDWKLLGVYEALQTDKSIHNRIR